MTKTKIHSSPFKQGHSKTSWSLKILR